MPRKNDFGHVVGVDEVGRGPVAGPVTVGVVAVRPSFNRAFFRGIRDSKKLGARARDEWFARVKEAMRQGDLVFSVASVGPHLVDRRGISWATRRAIARAIARLDLEPDKCLVLLDGGLRAPKYFYYQRTIIRGEEREPVIALASIVAKVTRDRKMARLANRYPDYGFETHKGYGTRGHFQCLKRRGLCDIHRRSFLRNLT